VVPVDAQLVERGCGPRKSKCVNIDRRGSAINHHGVLTLAADSTCQPCASSDVYVDSDMQLRSEALL
jgi:hypothetical protein